MIPAYLPSQPAVVFEEKVRENHSDRCPVTKSVGLAYAALVAGATQVRVTADTAEAVPLHEGRLAQSELMNLPTVEVQGRRSSGMLRGKMIVMRKRS